MSMGTLMVLQSAEARRRRDSRGRYMEDDGDDMRMRGGQGNNQYTRERRNEMTMGHYGMEPDMRRSDGYNRDNPDMRMPGVYPSETRRERRRSDMHDEPEMRGEGHFIWDNAEGMDDRRNGAQDAREGANEMRMSYDKGPSNVTDMRTYSHINHASPESDPMHHRHMTQNRIGFQHHGKSLTREDAQEWVHSMRAADGSRGGRWKNMADVKQLAERMGITGEKEMVEFFAIINAMYSDYCKVAKKHGVDKPEFYADLAKAWIHDEDAEDNKAMLYYECIVKKD